MSTRSPATRTAASRTWTPSLMRAAFIFDPSLVTIAGGVITAAQDLGGGATTLTSSAGQEFAIDNAGALNGRYPMRTSNASGKLFASTGGAVGNGPWDLIVVAALQGVGTGPATTSTLAQFGANAASNTVGIGANSINAVVFGNNSGTLGSYGAADTLVHVFRASYDGRYQRTYLDGKELGSPVAGPISIANAGVFGFLNWYVQPTYPILDARVYGAVFANDVLDQSTVTGYTRYICTRFGTKSVVFFGDSTTAGGAAGTTAAHYFPITTRTSALSNGATLLVQNQGISSQRTDEILARLMRYTDPCTHVMIWMGVNDLLQALPGGSASTGTAAGDAALIYAQITLAVARAHALGAKAIVGTIQQWNLSGGSLMDNTRIALNALITANAAGADAIADIATAFGVYNAANFCADHLHPNDTANDTLSGPTAAAAIATV